VIIRPFGDAVSAMVPIDVLERHVPAVTHAAARLHGPVGGVTRQPVGAVVAHGHQVGDLQRRFLVEHGGRVTHQLPEHGRLGVQLDQRELDALVCRQALAPRDATVGVGDGLVDAELRSAQRRRRLADAVLVYEVLGQVEPVVDTAEEG
jgi:hypothetical protein